MLGTGCRSFARYGENRSHMLNLGVKLNEATISLFLCPINAGTEMLGGVDLFVGGL